MKSFNVKSNAKRLARKLAAEVSGIEAVEPIAIKPGAREWYPTVAVVEGMKPEAIGPEVAECAIVVPDTTAQAWARAEAKAHGRDLDSGVTIKGKADGKPVIVGTPALDVAALAADLPPRKKSTPDEIAARRAERIKRIEADKASGKGIPKAKIILRLLRRTDGATLAELAAACGWQFHTVRGYIAGTLRKRGHDIRCVEQGRAGKSRYMIASADAS